MPCCEISDCAQMSKTIIAVRHFGLGGRESLETAVSKRKYAQSRSALGTFSTGTTTTKGYLERRRLLVSGDIPLPKILSYKDLMSKVNSIDIGELLPVNDLLSNALTPEDRVDGKYRDLESLLLSLAKFYFDTDPYRKAG